MKENDGNQDGVKDKSEEKADEDGDVHISVWVWLHKVFPREAAVSVISQKQGLTQNSSCFVVLLGFRLLANNFKFGLEVSLIFYVRVSLIYMFSFSFLKREQMHQLSFKSFKIAINNNKRGFK